uniref:Uncharacterized protein n=1 Tax=Alexandrium monilatum TaxID=311494 RepID=A0A7S4QKD5_9DINO
MRFPWPRMSRLARLGDWGRHAMQVAAQGALAAQARTRALATPSAGSQRAFCSGRSSRMLVKAEVSDFGRLAGGVLARLRAGQPTELDAVGEGAVGSAVKALALANALAGKDSSITVAFIPVLTSSDDKKLVRLTVHSVLTPTEKEPPDFSRGGLYVPADAAAVGRRAADSARARNAPGAAAVGAGAGNGGVATPTELARAVLGEWLRYAAPDLRAATRVAAVARTAGREASASVSSASAPGRQRAPFLLAFGPPALARAVRALAFVCVDLKKEHLAGSPSFVVVPRFGERRKPDRYLGIEKTTKFIALCLAHAKTGR